MNSQRDVASFLLRFKQHCWQESNGKPRVEWRGHIRHVQDGEELCFTDMAEAIFFIQDTLLQLAISAAPDADPDMQERIIRQSLKLWKRFSQTYHQMFPQPLPFFQPPTEPLFHEPYTPVESEIAHLLAEHDACESTSPPPALAQPDLPASAGSGQEAQLALVLEKLTALQAQLEDISSRMAK
jgi:hypothetical protein